MYFWQRFREVGRGEAKGEMSEWFKEHAWKVCVLQKGTAGSNPALSAIANNARETSFQSYNQNHLITL